MAFNLKEERETGYFDESGFYVENKVHQIFSIHTRFLNIWSKNFLQLNKFLKILEKIISNSKKLAEIFFFSGEGQGGGGGCVANVRCRSSRQRRGPEENSGAAKERNGTFSVTEQIFRELSTGVEERMSTQVFYPIFLLLCPLIGGRGPFEGDFSVGNGLCAGGDGGFNDGWRDRCAGTKNF